MKKLKITVSYSRSSMDSWSEGRKLSFIVEGNFALDKEKLDKLVDGYLEAANINFYEYMYRVEEVA